MRVHRVSSTKQFIFKRFASSHSKISRRLKKDHYKTLGITPKANLSDVKEAYYTQSKLHHPDKNPGSTTAAAQFQAVTEAYNILGTPYLRERYDAGFGPAKLDPVRSKVKRPSTFDKSQVQYNFDEFYERHYGDAIKHAQIRKKKEEILKQQAKTGEPESGMWVLTSVPIIIFILYKYFEKR